MVARPGALTLDPNPDSVIRRERGRVSAQFYDRHRQPSELSERCPRHYALLATGINMQPWIGVTSTVLDANLMDALPLTTRYIPSSVCNQNFFDSCDPLNFSETAP